MPKYRKRSIVAYVLDFFTAFAASGMLVGYLTGGLTDNGFQLDGLPAFGAFALIVLYFVLFKKLDGRTLWQMIFGVPRDYKARRQASAEAVF